MDLEIEEVRERGRIVSTAAIVAVGVNTDGRREVPGIYRPFGDGALLPLLTDRARMCLPTWRS
ncbi:hypothetical protein MBESOW_P3753 [Sphingobium xenophagum]|uniref:Uncharacterized protein n=1 Tax=Sphingobium xenophagum TaxID=121428 RepID=A0A401J791_SPHXE|nr:hypothetical protein MBESOW_P3753 [Sphingobium xenophagum]